MLRVRVVGNGWTGAPSFSTFYFIAGGTENLATCDFAVARVQAFLTALKPLWFTQQFFQVQPDVDIVTPSTGLVTDTIATTPVPQVQGSSGTTSLPKMAAALVKLVTSTFFDGRRLRGRIFIAPLATAVVDATGANLSVASQATLTAAGNALFAVTSPTVVPAVWHRPRKANATHVPPVAERPGAAAPVTSTANVNRLYTLRSRSI